MFPFLFSIIEGEINDEPQTSNRGIIFEYTYEFTSFPVISLIYKSCFHRDRQNTVVIVVFKHFFYLIHQRAARVVLFIVN
jgi:hypothetical protein